MNSRNLRSLIIVFTILFSPSLRAEALLRVSPLKQKGWISWDSDYDKDSELWNSFCEALGKQLLTNPGPGFLASYHCGSSNPPPAPLPLWHIQLIEHKDSFELKVAFLFEGGSEEIRTWSFPTGGSVLKNLAADSMPILIARMLVENLPSGWAYKHVQDKLSLSTQEQIFTLPQNLFIYDLFYDKKEGIWIPRLYARIIRDGDQEIEADSKTYSMDTRYRPLLDGKTYWIRALENKERDGKYQKFITDALQGKRDLSLPKSSKREKVESNFVSDLLLGSFRSSFIGFRYGKSIARADPLLAQMSLVSIIAEIGGGPLAGLRWYYDVFPEVKSGSDGEEEYFNLRRASLGWAFNFEMPASIRPLINKVDLQPKIGLLDLKSYTFVSTPDGKRRSDFDAKNIYDLALEAGAENTSSWFRSRLWGAFSTASLGVSNKTAVTVKSLRGGIDLYFDLYRSGHWDLNLLTFVTVEHLNIAKDPKSLDANSRDIYSLSSDLAFAGLGLTISW